MTLFAGTLRRMRLLFALLVAAALALTAGAARADDYATVALPAADAASSEKRSAERQTLSSAPPSSRRSRLSR